MALKTILNKQTDFTGEFPEDWAKSMEQFPDEIMYVKPGV